MSDSFANPWTVAHQASLCIGFSRQEYLCGLPFPSPGNLPNPGIKPASPALAGGFFTTEPPGKPLVNNRCTVNYISPCSSPLFPPPLLSPPLLSSPPACPSSPPPGVEYTHSVGNPAPNRHRHPAQQRHTPRAVSLHPLARGPPVSFLSVGLPVLELSYTWSHSVGLCVRPVSAQGLRLTHSAPCV